MAYLRINPIEKTANLIHAANAADLDAALRVIRSEYLKMISQEGAEKR